MKRTPAIVLVATAVLLGACRDMGLPGNIPAEEARRAAPPELVAEVYRPTGDREFQLVMDGRLWVPTGQPVTVAEDRLRPVGSAAGQTVYARRWDERPYSVLFTRMPMAEPGAAGTAREAMAATRQQWQEFAPVTGRRGQAVSPDPTRQPDPGQ